MQPGRLTQIPIRNVLAEPITVLSLSSPSHSLPPVPSLIPPSLSLSLPLPYFPTTPSSLSNTSPLTVNFWVKPWRLWEESQTNYTTPLMMRTPSRNELSATLGQRFSVPLASEYSFRPAGLNEMWDCGPRAKMPTARPSVAIVCIHRYHSNQGNSYALQITCRLSSQNWVDPQSSSLQAPAGAQELILKLHLGWFPRWKFISIQSTMKYFLQKVVYFVLGTPCFNIGEHWLLLYMIP